MTKVFEVIYENGVFRPIDKLNLKDGEKLKIRIEEKSSKNISKLLEKYIIESDVDLSKMLVEERR